MKQNGLASMEDVLAVLLGMAPVQAPAEEVDALDAAGRVLAKDIVAGIDVPPADNSAMDGYAVRHADLANAGAGLPVSQRIPAGAVPAPLAAGTAARIFTGGTMPAGADTVVPQEQARADGERVAFDGGIAVGDWVRERGCDIRAGGRILEAGAWLRPQDVALAASIGIARLPVRPALRVATFSTGSELAMPGQPLGPGQIYNSNRYLLRGLLGRLPVAHADLGAIGDDAEATREALREAARHSDLVVTTGGVSVGEEDHVKPAVQALGSLDVWRLGLKPGKPLAVGRLRRDDGSEAVFIGLPGNPVSSFVTFALFVRPLVLRLAGARHAAPPRTPVRADFDWPQADARREFLRVRRNAEGGLELYPNQLSAVLTSVAWGDGLVDNPAGRTIRQGDLVDYIAFSDLE